MSNLSLRPHVMTLTERIVFLREQIDTTCQHYQRNINTIHLVAVSKGQSIEAMKEAFAAGIRDFGENYWQEAHKKINALSPLPITWHFIGPLQSNKAPLIAHHFAWVHSLCREKIATQLALHRPAGMASLNVCLQINIDDELNKQGIGVTEIPGLIRHVLLFPQLTLRGFMALPRPHKTPEEQFRSFSKLRQILDETNQRFALNLDTLSMGMSDDFLPAIHAGSTLLRIGRALFGERP